MNPAVIVLLTEVQKHKIGLHVLDSFDSSIINSLIRMFDTPKTKCTFQPIRSTIKVWQLCSTEHVINCLVGCKMMKPVPRIAHVYL
jgi:hypothetical protein